MSMQADFLQYLKRFLNRIKTNSQSKAEDIEEILQQLSRREKGILEALALTDDMEKTAALRRDLEIIHAHQLKGRAAVERINGDKE